MGALPYVLSQDAGGPRRRPRGISRSAADSPSPSEASVSHLREPRRGRTGLVLTEGVARSTVWSPAGPLVRPGTTPRRGRQVDWWLTDSEGIVASWLLVFALCNGLRGMYCWFRDQDERRVVERLLAFKPHPVRASFLLGGMTEATETAVCMLVDDGAVKVSSTGELRPTRRGRKQTDHALRALAEAIRATPSGTTTPLHEIPTEARFAPFRQRVEHRAPAVHLTASGKSQSSCSRPRC